ncbi:MAG: menaquinone biosynthesis protein [Candidatus Thermoplasmatota archaeon]|nr:menaquinone biosynthesis protein [Candidatus Thermoplasmatota archaeon]
MVVNVPILDNTGLSSWKTTIGRVAFMNCDPLFLQLSDSWDVLSAPPSWLTGHLMRRDCVIAPIPAADYAKNTDKLALLPDLGICSKGEVGSVLLFGSKSIDKMESISLPSDSSSSVALLKFILAQKGLNPKLTVMGPDIDSMLAVSDGALIIGDRALDASRKYPQKVVLDLGLEWQELTGYPMVFGVFAARKDTPISTIKKAYDSLLEQLVEFELSSERRKLIVELSSKNSGLPVERMDQYFGEVFNRLDNEHISGLNRFLRDACKISEGAEFFRI